MRKLTQAQIKAWKEEHVSIHQIDITRYQDDDPGRPEVLSCVVKKPSLDEIIAAEEFAKGDEVKKAIFLFKNCFLGGDESFLIDDELRLSAGLQVGKIFRLLEGTIKKL